MTRAIALKELREASVFAGLGLLALLLVTTSHMGWNPLWGRASNEYPFLGDAFPFQFGLVAVLLATALGLWQSLGDPWGGAQLFLLHRPISRRQLYGTKLVIGLAVYVLCAALPVLLYGWWASLPGTIAAPFYWSMTGQAWATWLAGTAVYLGAFLTGLRPAAWLGTRFAPLAASLLVVFPLAVCRWAVFLPGLFVAWALFTTLVLFVANERDTG